MDTEAMREMARYGNALRQDWTRELSLASDEIDRLRAVLNVVHADCIRRADRDGTVPIGASAWAAVEKARQ